MLNSLTLNKLKENVDLDNPRILIVNMLKRIDENNSLFEFLYNNIGDIYQIAMLDEMYFKIGFFRKENEKEKDNS